MLMHSSGKNDSQLQLPIYSSETRNIQIQYIHSYAEICLVPCMEPPSQLVYLKGLQQFIIDNNFST